MQVRSDTVGFGTEIPLDTFPELLTLHLSKVPGTKKLEGQGQRLINNDFPDADAWGFVDDVCRGWGKGHRVWARVRDNNETASISNALREAVQHVNASPPDLVSAIKAVRTIKHLGMSFGSKQLRFLSPELCPVFDDILASALPYPKGSSGFARFALDCRRLGEELTGRNHPNPQDRPQGKWWVADVEAAIFAHVQQQRKQPNWATAD